MAIRILMYCSASRQEPGGVQAVFSRLAESLRQRGHEVVEAWPETGADPAPGQWACSFALAVSDCPGPGPCCAAAGSCCA